MPIRHALSGFAAAAFLVTMVWAQAPAIRQTILAIEDRRASEPDDVKTLLDATSRRDETLAVAAVRALGRLERPSLVEDLVRFLDVSSPLVRAQAVNAIGQAVSAASGEPVERARSVLQTRLAAESHDYVRGVIAETLGRLPYSAPESVRAVEKILVETSLRPGGTLSARPSTSATVLGAPVMGVTIGFDTTRQDARLPVLLGAAKGLEALIRQNIKIATPDPTTHARLQRLLVTARAAMPTGTDQSAADLARVRRLALQALIAAGGSDERTIVAAQQDEDVQVRRLAAQAVGVVAELNGRDTLIARALDDDEPMVRVEAVRAYGRAPRRDRGCMPLVEATGDRSLRVSVAAIDQLASGCDDPGPAVKALLRDIGSLGTAGTDGWHRAAHAMVSLAGLSPDQARPALSSFAVHAVWQVRMYAARAAAPLRELETLERLAADEQPNVRESAITGLLGLRAHDADAIYISALESRDYQLVRTAARALKGSPAREKTVRALVTALARLTADRRDTSRDARLAILSTLGELGSVSDAKALEPYLSDFDPRIAAESASILTAWTGQKREAITKAFAPQPVPAWEELAALENARARVLMRRGGAFEMALYPSEAPLTVARFVRLARQGDYDGLTFHRVVPNFVIQGGSPGANEYVGDGPYMRDEVGLKPHTRGAVGISTRGRDTGDAQIFIDLVDNPRLDHQYTVFAEVVRGLDVVDDVREGDVIERVEVVTPARK